MKKKISMRKKVYLFIQITTIVLFVMFFVFLSNIMLEFEYQKYASSAQRRVDSLCSNVDRVFYSVMDRSNNIANNKLVWDIIVKREHPDYFMGDLDFLKKFFASFTEYENYISGQYHIYTNNDTIPENLYFSDLSRLQAMPYWETIANISTSEVAWIYSDNTYISAYSKISYGKESKGYLEIKIPLKQLENILLSEPLDKNEIIIFSDSENNILFSNSNLTPPKNAVSFSQTVIPGFRVSMYTQKSFIYRSCLIYISIAAVFLVMLFVLISFLYMWLIKKLTYDFDSFVDALERDESSLLNPQFIDETEDDGIIKIKVKFKKLIHRINLLHQEIEAINNEKKKLELATLQKSFTPHLLYNSLSVLKWRLYETDDELMMQMIDLMVEYYRSVLADGNNIITVSEEIDLIEQYLQIVRISYNKEFSLDIHVEDSVKDCYIIKQILQPVVENAVLHGLSQTDDARLEISVYKQENTILFEVTDNGCGMNDELLSKLTADDVELKNRKKKSYGIKNTVDRIKTYYGPDYGVTVKSAPQKGTKVILTAEYLEKNALSERLQK